MGLFSRDLEFPYGHTLTSPFFSMRKATHVSIMVVGGKGGEGEGMGIYVGADFAGWLWVSHTQNADIIFIKKRYIAMF